MLWAGLEKMGLKCHVAIEHRLPSLTTVCIPDGIDGKALCTCVGHTTPHHAIPYHITGVTGWGGGQAPRSTSAGAEGRGI
jgi:hypothetical protein